MAAPANPGSEPLAIDCGDHRIGLWRSRRRLGKYCTVVDGTRPDFTRPHLRRAIPARFGGLPSEREEKSWDDVPEQIKATFEKIGIPEAERKFLAVVGAQYDSEVVYHSRR